METDTKAARDIINSTLDERGGGGVVGRGLTGQEKEKGRRKKIKTAPDKSYCCREKEEDRQDVQSESEDEMDDNNEEYDVLAKELLPFGDSAGFSLAYWDQHLAEKNC